MPKSERTHRPKPLCMQVRSVRDNHLVFLLCLLRQSLSTVCAGIEAHCGALRLWWAWPSLRGGLYCSLPHAMLLARSEIKALQSHVTHLSNLSQPVNNMPNMFLWGQIVKQNSYDVICNIQCEDNKNLIDILILTKDAKNHTYTKNNSCLTFLCRDIRELTLEGLRLYNNHHAELKCEIPHYRRQGLKFKYTPEPPSLCAEDDGSHPQSFWSARLKWRQGTGINLRSPLVSDADACIWRTTALKKDSWLMAGCPASYVCWQQIKGGVWYDTHSPSFSQTLEDREVADWPGRVNRQDSLVTVAH